MNNYVWQKLSVFLLVICVFSLLVSQTHFANATNRQIFPFFDRINNPVQNKFPTNKKEDITPPPPTLNAFDNEVLQVCGAFNSRVEPEAFKRALLKYPEILSKTQQAVEGSLFPNRKTTEAFLEDLTDIWFKRGGFKHIFCGEKKPPQKPKDDIGGLHFVGRYLQLQQQGIGGLLPDNAKNQEVVPGLIYTLGVAIKQDNLLLEDDLKGYDLVSNAQEILINGTKAFKLELDGNMGGDCLYTVRDDRTNRSFQAVFVSRDGGIITLYSDATPSGRPCGS